jgi:subtilisin family serine protease
VKTYVVFPTDLGPPVSQFEAGTQDLSVQRAVGVRELLMRAGISAPRLLTNSGLIGPSGDIEAPPLRGAALGRDGRVPRVLEALDVALIDDPTPDQIDRLHKWGAAVFENVEVPLVEPVATNGVPAAQAAIPWHLQTINVAAARAQGLTGQGVRIGIIDTGIDAMHSEFAGKSISFAEYDASGYLISTTPRDAGDHGTHVSALAAGATYGVAPEAELAVAAVLTTRTPRGMVGYLAQILAGFNWIAHSNHASTGISQCPVINASLGGIGYDPYLDSSVVTIRSVPAALLIAAIGNAGRAGVNNHGSPGNYHHVLGVGATDPTDVVTNFSDWGIESTHAAYKPDLCAPGLDIESARPGGGTQYMSGTSMASPQVAGAAALLVQKSPPLRRNPQGLYNRLLRLVDNAPTTNPVNRASGFSRIGAGRLDLTHI